MYNKELIDKLIAYISQQNDISDKDTLAPRVQKEFSLTKDGSVFYCQWFAIRYCKAKLSKFSNTVLSLSTLHKYDHIPFIICLVSKKEIAFLLANTTFLKKISQTSQKLRVDNIRGSFNGSDIVRVFDDIPNTPENFEELFSIHTNYTFEENLVRLVEATNNIVPKGHKFVPTEPQIECIRNSVNRAISFLNSEEYQLLNQDLNDRVHAVETEIAIASLIDNVNLRGRIIEYLITEESSLKDTLMDCLRTQKPLPKIFTSDKLGDYERVFDNYVTETDIKTKVLFLSSNPKGYNIDKLLAFLSTEKSIYLIFIVTISEANTIQTRLCSLFNQQLLAGTRTNSLWAGRNSRGVTQYDGKVLENIVENFDPTIDAEAAQNFLDKLLNS